MGRLLNKEYLHVSELMLITSTFPEEITSPFSQRAVRAVWPELLTTYRIIYTKEPGKIESTTSKSLDIVNQYTQSSIHKVTPNL